MLTRQDYPDGVGYAGGPVPRLSDGTVSGDLLRLARLAVARQKARRDEDVGRWAWRLARDVAGATD